MIKEFTGGDICYGMPVNTVGLVIVLTILVLIAFIAGRGYQMRINDSND